MITLFKPYVSQRARDLVQQVLSGTQLAEGPMVKAFEEAFALKYGFKNVASVNSGTSALELAYELAGIGEGDEVVTPVLTCTATNLPIIHRGAKPVFADITADLVIDPKSAESRITKKTKALVYVHFGGYAGGLKAIQDLGKKYNLPVIEDAAQSVGGEGWGTSEFTCVSLQAIKTLTSGDGGFLICKSDEDDKKARKLRWFGIDRPLKQMLGDIDVTEAGYKMHMNDISAAIGLGNLETIDIALDGRERASEAYRSSGVPLLVRPWLVILVHPKALEVNAALEAIGIHTNGHHYRNDKYTVFGGRASTTIITDRDAMEWESLVPNMDRLEDGYTLLPFHQDITPADVEIVMDVVRGVVSRRETNIDTV